MAPRRQLPHTADTAWEIEAADRNGLVQESLAALAEVLGLPGDPDPPAGETGEWVSVSAEVDDAATLVRALNEWLYWVQVRGWRPGRTAVRWVPDGIQLHLVSGRPVRPAPLETEIKAVTLHLASVIPPDGPGRPWRATWVADL